MSTTVAGGVNIVISVNAANYTDGLKKAQGELTRFTQRSQAAGHASVSSMQAASASIRELNGNFANNTRAVERFITMIPGVGTALKAAFPLIGGLAFGAMIVDMGQKVATFIKNVNQMPATIAKGFADLNLSQKTTTDQLILATDRVQNELDKLNKKPQNNVKMALDESRLAADRLAESIVSTNAKLNELLSKDHVSAWAVLMGKSGTAATEGAAQYWQKRSDHDAYQLANAEPGTPAAASAQQTLAATQAAHLKDLRDDLANRKQTVAETGSADDANIASDEGQITILLNQQRQAAAEQHSAAVAAEKQKADDRVAALAAAKQAAEKRLQQWESDNSDWKAVQDRSLADDAAWWQQKLDTLNKNSLNYIAVNKKVNADLIAINRQNAEAISKYTTEYLADFDKTDGLSADATKQLADSGKATVAWITSLKQGIDLTKQSGDALSEESIKMALATGNMTKLAAARATANLHTAQYKDQTDDFAEQRKAIAADPTLSPMARNAANADLDNRTNQAAQARTIQVRQDDQATNPATSSGLDGFTNALDEFVNSTRDAAKTMEEITKSTLGGLNSEFTKGITGQRTNFGGTFMGIGQGVLNKGMESVEGSMLGAFGFGGKKADGSKANPLYVRIADAVSGDAKSAASGLMSLFKSGSSGSSSSSSGGGSSITSTIGGLFSKAIGFLPHFAAGGPISANMLSVVGENGPELFNPSTSGTVIPNHQISITGGGGGGGDTHNWNIDARGATDPAAVRAAVAQGAKQAVAASQAVAHRQSVAKPQKT